MSSPTACRIRAWDERLVDGTDDEMCCQAEGTDREAANPNNPRDLGKDQSEGLQTGLRHLLMAVGVDLRDLGRGHGRHARRDAEVGRRVGLEPLDDRCQHFLRKLNVGLGPMLQFFDDDRANDAPDLLDRGPVLRERGFLNTVEQSRVACCLLGDVLRLERQEDVGDAQATDVFLAVVAGFDHLPAEVGNSIGDHVQIDGRIERRAAQGSGRCTAAHKGRPVSNSTLLKACTTNGWPGSRSITERVSHKRS